MANWNIPWHRLLSDVFESNLRDDAYWLCISRIRVVLVLWPKSHLQVGFHVSSHVDVGFTVRFPSPIITYDSFIPDKKNF